MNDFNEFSAAKKRIINDTVEHLAGSITCTDLDNPDASGSVISSYALKQLKENAVNILRSCNVSVCLPYTDNNGKKCYETGKCCNPKCEYLCEPDNEADLHDMYELPEHRNMFLYSPADHTEESYTHQEAPKRFIRREEPVEEPEEQEEPDEKRFYLKKNIHGYIQEKKEKKKKLSKFEQAWNTVTSVIVALVVLMTICFVGVRIVGYKPYAILSGSMSPEYNVGDLVYVKHQNPVTISRGDVITYVADKRLTVVTHRVYDVDRINQTFTTKGDANEAPDMNPVSYQNVLGVAQFSIPKLGFVTDLLSQKSGKFTLTAMIAGFILLAFAPEIYKVLTEADQKKK